MTEMLPAFSPVLQSGNRFYMDVMKYKLSPHYDSPKNNKGNTG